MNACGDEVCPRACSRERVTRGSRVRPPTACSDAPKCASVTWTETNICPIMIAQHSSPGQRQRSGKAHTLLVVPGEVHAEVSQQHLERLLPLLLVRIPRALLAALILHDQSSDAVSKTYTAPSLLPAFGVIRGPKPKHTSVAKSSSPGGRLSSPDMSDAIVAKVPPELWDQHFAQSPRAAAMDHLSLRGQ